MYIMYVVFPVAEDRLFIQHNQTMCAEGGKSYRTLSFKRVWKDSVVAYIHFSRVELATEIMCRGFPDSCSQAG